MICKIGDAFSLIRNGANIKQGMDDTGYPITRIETISNRVVDRSKMGYAGIYDLTRYADYILQDGDILMSHINSESHLGKVALYEKDPAETIIHGMNLLCLRPKHEIINSRYAFYFLSSDTFLRQIPRIAKKSVNQASFTVAALKELDIIIAPMDRQLEIASVLDKVNEIIALQKKQLAKLDELVKARFVEMFGDPLSNNKGWPCITITEACRAIFGGGTPSKSHPEYFTGTIPWVSPKDMKSAVIYDSIDHITEEAVAHSTTNLVPANSVLMVIRSGILKHTLPVAINSLPVTINQDMKAFIPSEKITSAFLLHYFKAIEADVLAGVRGVTADNIDFKAFQQRMIIVPPIELQTQFAAFVQSTDQVKATIQTSLDELETLKKSLMQNYFG